MTSLTRTVRRECCRTAEHARPVIVTLEPGDLIRFRLKGTRTTYTTTLLACYHLAARIYATEQAKQRVATRKARRLERKNRP